MKHDAYIIILTLLVLTTFSSAANIGISPAKIHFANVLRGGYAQGSVSIVIDSENTMEVEVEPIGEIASWLNTSETIFEVSKEKPHYLQVLLNVPSDIPNGNYTGYISVKIYSTSQVEEGRLTGKIESNVNLKTTVEVVDSETIDCRISNLQISSPEENDQAILTLRIENNGNVRISPKISTSTWNVDQTKVLQTNELQTTQIFPTTSEEFTFDLPTETLDLDQYWLNIEVEECSYRAVKTFDVLEAGSLSTKGVILEIISETNATLGETVPINVGFKNIGEKQLTAQFKGEISRNGKVVKILESEKLEVTPSDTEEFKLYFTPESTGEYTISGRVYYEGKRTYEKFLTISVQGKTNSNKILYIILTLIIATLVYKIYREKKIGARI